MDSIVCCGFTCPFGIRIIDEIINGLNSLNQIGEDVSSTLFKSYQGYMCCPIDVKVFHMLIILKYINYYLITFTQEMVGYKTSMVVPELINRAVMEHHPLNSGGVN